MDDVILEGWPDHGWLTQHWPQLAHITLTEVNGGGLRMLTEHGAVHVKKRPRQSVGAEVWILDELTARGVPVTQLLPSVTGAKHQMHGNDAILVYSEIDGHAWHDYTLPGTDDRVRLVGGAAASLHAAMADIDITEAIARGLHVRRRRRGTEGLPLQIIHRDFHAGNVLFVGEQVSGYIDFDHLELGPRWVDPLYGSLSVMARLFEAGREDEWLPLLESMVRGYHAVSPITDLEVARTVELMIGIEEDFLAWFLPEQDEANALLTVLMIERVHRLRRPILDLVGDIARSAPR
ncbi:MULTISPECIES: phosphotransferase enzyme family protein [Aestuariimicrobium]|uniref:phosphotransferase enzyme family protein n=1 Tax=Aestuariimicrobium TaxID=396388 RepID=UPI0003B75315|nr:MULTISPECIES: phosphotransferase [Aestuariimicrobium]CAI9402809.1 Homoserine kinase [Aestuariimicrobium sp. T2.26MG-19.2B]